MKRSDWPKAHRLRAELCGSLEQIFSDKAGDNLTETWRNAILKNMSTLEQAY